MPQQASRILASDPGLKSALGKARLLAVPQSAWSQISLGKGTAFSDAALSLISKQPREGHGVQPCRKQVARSGFSP